MGEATIPNVSMILGAAHERMKAKYAYNDTIKKEEEQARELQEFLKTLKQEAYKRRSGNPVENVQQSLYDMILDSIKLPNNRTVGNLFRRTNKIRYKQGYMFEDDLNAVIAAVINLTNPDGKKTKASDYSIGKSTGVTGFLNLGEIVSEVAEEFTEQVAEEVGKVFSQNKTKSVFGKIDTKVDGKIVNLNASFNISPSVLDALSNATFTDKSYGSGTYMKNGEEFSFGSETIHLGNSDPYRAIQGALTSLNFGKTSFEYLYYAGQNIVLGQDGTPPKEDASYVATHIYHLRYLYELTGAGIIYSDYGAKYFGGAKFLVYNNPAGNDIYVVSTAKIISDLLLDESPVKNPFKAISISKGYFGS